MFFQTDGQSNAHKHANGVVKDEQQQDSKRQKIGEQIIGALGAFLFEDTIVEDAPPNKNPEHVQEQDDREEDRTKDIKVTFSGQHKDQSHDTARNVRYLKQEPLFVRVVQHPKHDQERDRGNDVQDGEQNDRVLGSIDRDRLFIQFGIFGVVGVCRAHGVGKFF